MSKQSAHFVIFRGSKRRYYWHFVGANGEIVAQSEGYLTRWSAKRGVKRFQALASQATLQDIAVAR